MHLYNFGGSESSPTTLSRDVLLCGNVNAGTTFEERRPLKFLESKKRQKFGAM